MGRSYLEKGNCRLAQDAVHGGAGYTPSLFSQRPGHYGYLALLTLAFLMTSTATRAQSTWTGAVSTNWFDLNNWAPPGVPGATTPVTITNPFSRSPEILVAGAEAQSIETAFLAFQNIVVRGAGTLTVGDSIVLPYGGLTVESGGTVTSSTGQLGGVVANRGSAIVTGLGSTWIMTGTFGIGGSGSAGLAISNGGLVRNNGDAFVGAFSGAVVTVNAATWINGGTLRIGPQFGFGGTLDIQNGGRVTSQNGFVGDGEGQASVAGVGSSWTNSALLRVGFGGRMSVVDGAVVTNADGNVRGSMLVSGAGSTWTNSGSLQVEQGNLTIQNGGVVTANTMSISGSGLVAGIVNIGAAADAGVAPAAPGTLNAPAIAFGAGISRIVFKPYLGKLHLRSSDDGWCRQFRGRTRRHDGADGDGIEREHASEWRHADR
jgi:T5SS/PEP-CTERM-associated repeat protein